MSCFLCSTERAGTTLPRCGPVLRPDSHGHAEHPAWRGVLSGESMAAPGGGTLPMTTMQSVPSRDSRCVLPSGGWCFPAPRQVVMPMHDSAQQKRLLTSSRLALQLLQHHCAENAGHDMTCSYIMFQVGSCPPILLGECELCVSSLLRVTDSALAVSCKGQWTLLSSGRCAEAQSDGGRAKPSWRRAIRRTVVCLPAKIRSPRVGLASQPAKITGLQRTGLFICRA